MAQDAGSKRGRGTDKAPVIFSLSLDDKGRSGYLHTQVVDTVDGDSITLAAKEHIQLGALIRSNGLSPYNQLSQKGYRHQSEVFDHKENPDHLKWMHIVISNAKAFIAGTYHGLSDTHLQLFLVEFYRVFVRFFRD